MTASALNSPRAHPPLLELKRIRSWPSGDGGAALVVYRASQVASLLQRATSGFSATRLEGQPSLSRGAFAEPVWRERARGCVFRGVSQPSLTPRGCRKVEKTQPERERDEEAATASAASLIPARRRRERDELQEAGSLAAQRNWSRRRRHFIQSPLPGRRADLLRRVWSLALTC